MLVNNLVPNMDLAQLLTIGINTSTLIVLIKFVRQVSRLEFKVDLMWGVFKRRFGTRDDDKELEEDP